MPGRNQSDSNSTSSDSYYGETPTGSIIDLSIRPSESDEDINIKYPVYAVATNVRVKGRNGIAPSLSKLFSASGSGLQQYPIKANKDQLWFDFYNDRAGLRDQSIFLFKNLNDAMRYCFSNSKSNTYRRSIHPIFLVEIHSQPEPATLLVGTPPHYDISNESESLFCYRIDNMTPSKVQCLELVIVDPDTQAIQETISYENKGGRSLDFWREKWRLSSGDNFEKALSLLSQYAGKNRVDRFFSGHWRTHHGSAVLKALNQMNAFDIHLGLIDEPLKELFIQLKTQLNGEPLKASGDLSRILWVIEEKTGESFDGVAKRQLNPFIL